MAAMTRGEFAIRLANALGLNMSQTGGFSDTAGTMYDGAATALKNAGIVSGTGPGVFNAGMIVTRAQAATMFARAVGLEPNLTGPFTDLPERSGMNMWIQATGNAGLFRGVAPGRFDPDSPFQARYFDDVVGRNAFQNAIRPQTPTPTEPEPFTEPDVEPSEPGLPDEDMQDILDAQQRDIVLWMEGVIRNDYGIDDPRVTDFLETAFNERYSPNRFRIELYRQDWFKDAFPEIQGRIDAGRSPLTPEAVMALRDTYRQEFTASGAPSSFYGSDAIAQLIIGDVSPMELRGRLAAADAMVDRVAPEVRQWFAGNFGVSGESMLYGYFLDRDRTLAEVETQLSAAQIGGAASNVNIGLGVDRAMRLAGLGVTRAGATQSFRRLDATRALYDETVSETENLDVNREGVEAEFGLTPGAQRRVERRRLARIAALSGGGGAAATQEGIIGLG